MLALDHSIHIPHGTWWLDRGIVLTLPETSGVYPFSDLDLPFRTFGLMYVRHTKAGSLIKWDVEKANTISLAIILDYLIELTPPFRLEFYKSGWAFEDYRSPEETKIRIKELQNSRGSSIKSSVFVERRDIRQTHDMAPLIRKALEAPLSEIRQHQLLYEYDAAKNTFVMIDAGPHAGLVQVMGEDWMKKAIGTSTTPHQDSDYDRLVVPPYFEVLNSGLPYYDFVVASVSTPNEGVMWTPYQRIIQPLCSGPQPIGVTVTSQLVPSVVPLDPV